MHFVNLIFVENITPKDSVSKNVAAESIFASYFATVCETIQICAIVLLLRKGIK